MNEEGLDIQFAELKLMQVLSKNPGYSKTKNICGIFGGETSYKEIEEFSPENISSFKYAPIISCNVEWSFFFLI